MNPRTRLVLAFLGAPLVPQLFLFKTIAGSYASGQFPRLIVIAVLALSYCLMLTAGIATHLILRRQHRLGWLDYLLTGAWTGAIFGVGLVVMLRVAQIFIETPRPATFGMLIAVGLIGAMLMGCIAAFFWFIARPDKT